MLSKEEFAEFTGFVSSMWADSLTFEQLRASYALGLCGEASEFKQACALSENPESRLKEGGDVLHYLVGLMALYNVPYRLVMVPARQVCEIQDKYLQASTNYAVNLQDAAAAAADSIKKNLFHGKPEADMRGLLIVSMTHCAKYLCSALAAERHSMQDAAQNNITKLRARHGAKFNPAVYKGDHHVNG